MAETRRERHRNWFMPPRFLLFLAAFAAAGAALIPFTQRWSEAVLGGFDAAALAYIASLYPLTRDRDAVTLRRHARDNDSGRAGVLVITLLLLAVIATAVRVELPDAHASHGNGHGGGWGLALVLMSLVTAWLFANTIYALHYAHMYFRGDSEGGLNFPRDRDGSGDESAVPCPQYWDFVYFSLTIGMAFATSDVEINDPAIRRVAVLHGAAAFFYNLIVLAFTINVTASS
jgi:uncharacterized membrane protein